jgi:hypothetical protein
MFASWCSSPTLPPAQQLPQRPLRCLIMAALQQQHKQHITAYTPLRPSHKKKKSSTAIKQKYPSFAISLNQRLHKQTHHLDAIPLSCCSSPTLPPAQKLPHRPLLHLIMAALQQQHKQHITAPLHDSFMLQSTTHCHPHRIYHIRNNINKQLQHHALTTKVSKPHIGVVAHDTVDDVQDFLAYFFAHFRSFFCLKI